jgi:hypothetical protein
MMKKNLFSCVGHRRYYYLYNECLILNEMQPLVYQSNVSLIFYFSNTAGCYQPYSGELY